jgi:large subunit ribosomal protein L18
VSNKTSKNDARLKRQVRVRKKVKGTTERPRLNVFKSSRHIHAQIIDDSKGVTLVAVSSISPDLKSDNEYTGNIAAAKKVGAAIAKKAIDNNIVSVVFDRNGFLYHGRIKALADAARENGLSF